MYDTFQSYRSARFILAYQRTQRHRESKKKEFLFVGEVPTNKKVLLGKQFLAEK
jgi:hypothetical protein